MSNTNVTANSLVFKTRCAGEVAGSFHQFTISAKWRGVDPGSVVDSLSVTCSSATADSWTGGIPVETFAERVVLAKLGFGHASDLTGIEIVAEVV